MEGQAKSQSIPDVKTTSLKPQDLPGPTNFGGKQMDFIVASSYTVPAEGQGKTHRHDHLHPVAA